MMTLKREGNNLYDSHQLRLKVREYMERPDDDHTVWVPAYNISDEKEDPRFTVIFATNRTLQQLRKCDQLHVEFSQPLIACGVTGDTGKFSVSLIVLSSHDDCKAWTEVFSFLHSVWVHTKVLLGDGGWVLTEAYQRASVECGECQCSGGKPLTNWHHVNREQNSFLCFYYSVLLHIEFLAIGD